jgi:hypothetical protein
MFATPNNSVQLRNAAQAEWGVNTNLRLFKLRMTKKQLAQMMNVNYCQLCSVISGTVINAKLQAAIVDKITELESARQTATPA